MTLQEEITLLKEVKEKCLNNIVQFVKQIPAEGTTQILNPAVAAQLYDFAERAISNISNKKETSTNTYQKYGKRE